MKTVMKKKATKSKAARPKRRSAWDRLSAAGKRVAVAKDVLRQLDAGLFEAHNGIYFEEVNGPRPDFGCNIKKNHECRACAKGGLMIGWMRLTKREPEVVKLKDHGHWNYEDNGKATVRRRGRSFVREMTDQCVTNSLLECFDHRTLNLIESCFENWESSCRWARLFEFQELKDAGQYGKVADLRMRGIMGNIIRNKGEFIPKEGPIFVKLRSPAKRKTARK